MAKYRFFFIYFFPCFRQWPQVLQALGLSSHRFPMWMLCVGSLTSWAWAIFWTEQDFGWTVAARVCTLLLFSVRTREFVSNWTLLSLGWKPCLSCWTSPFGLLVTYEAKKSESWHMSLLKGEIPAALNPTIMLVRVTASAKAVDASWKAIDGHWWSRVSSHPKVTCSVDDMVVAAVYANSAVEMRRLWCHWPYKNQVPGWTNENHDCLAAKGLGFPLNI